MAPIIRPGPPTTLRVCGGRVRAAGDEKYRLRQGDYRILYEIVDRELVVTVVKVGNRRDAHR